VLHISSIACDNLYDHSEGGMSYCSTCLTKKYVEVLPQGQCKRFSWGVICQSWTGKWTGMVECNMEWIM